jgi:phage terminase large subunit-like protein
LTIPCTLLSAKGTENRIRAKTCWNADTLRGDYADLLILDEVQLMAEDTWGTVGAPMLLDNNGDAIFIYTPPSLHSRSTSKARDKGWITKFAKKHTNDPKGRWEIFSFTSRDNPHISREALDEITEDMTATAIRQEIEAVDLEEAPGALWTRVIIEKHRTNRPPDRYEYIVVGVDPSATSTGDEAGIITVGRFMNEYYVLSDDTMQGSPNAWATAAVTAFHKFKANKIVAEANNGGEMVQAVLEQVDKEVPIQLVHASRGKETRAEPVSAIYEKGEAHHVGSFELLEDEMVLWTPGDPSPNRMDALVWAMTALKRKTSDSGGFAV